MKKSVFITFYAFRLSVENVLGLVTTTVDLALPMKNLLGDIALAALNQLIIEKEMFERMVNYPRKSLLTKLIAEARNDRKERFAEIKRIVKLNAKGRDEQKKNAAQVIDFFFAGYWNVINEPMNTISGVITGMIAKYNADADLKVAAAQIGIDTLIIEFGAVNSNFDSLYKQRMAEDAAHELSASDQKVTVCNSYNDFCNVILQAVNFQPNESILKLYKNMDELRKTYRNLVPKEKESNTDNKTKA